MKKYIIPALRVADIESGVILTGSVGLDNGDGVGDRPGHTQPGYGGGYARRRGHKQQFEEDIYFEDDIDEEGF